VSLPIGLGGKVMYVARCIDRHIPVNIVGTDALKRLRPLKRYRSHLGTGAHYQRRY
jgi:hypothetical protein